MPCTCTSKPVIGILTILMCLLLLDYQLDVANIFLACTREGETLVKLCAMSDRLQLIQQRCGSKYKPVKFTNMNESELRPYIENMIVDDSHKVLYCDIEKVGSTTWKNILANNSNGKEPLLLKPTRDLIGYGINRYGLKWLTQSENTSYIKHVLQNYWKFTIVRHPFTRFISGFKDKLTPNNRDFYIGAVKNYILPALRGDSKRDASKPLSFDEYVEFTIRYGLVPQGHFTLMNDHCFPCEIDYDYIGRLETHATDEDYIVNHKLSGFTSNSKTHLYSRWGSAGGAHLNQLLSIFENVPPQNIKKLHEVLSQDMELFGYTIDVLHNKSLQTSCHFYESDGCC